MHVRVCECVYVCVVCRSEDILQELIVSCYLASGDQDQIIMFGGKDLYTLNYPMGSLSFIFKIIINRPCLAIAILILINLLPSL